MPFTNKVGKLTDLIILLLCLVKAVIDVSSLGSVWKVYLSTITASFSEIDPKMCSANGCHMGTLGINSSIFSVANRCNFKYRGRSKRTGSQFSCIFNCKYRQIAMIDTTLLFLNSYYTGDGTYTQSSFIVVNACNLGVERSKMTTKRGHFETPLGRDCKRVDKNLFLCMW
jgi:hypothetical protein